MADITLEDVLELAEQLTPDEQARLIEVLQAKHPRKGKRPPLNFPVDDVGPWPESLSLRREDMYGDDER
jgi:hypothetical protein